METLPSHLSEVIRFDWLFDYQGAGGQAVSQSGAVTGGCPKSKQNRSYSLSSGAPFTSTVYAEGFNWTTDTVHVTARDGTFPTVLQRTGYDARTAMGSGRCTAPEGLATRTMDG